MCFVLFKTSIVICEIEIALIILIEKKIVIVKSSGARDIEK